MRPALRSSAAVAVLAADIGMLIRLRPDWPSLTGDLSHPHRWVMRVGVDSATATVVTAALWICAVWLGAALLIIGLTRVPGVVGAVADQVAARIVPAAVLRLVGATVGVSITLGALSPAVVTAGTTGSTAPAPASMSAPGWPTSTPAAPTVPTWPVSPAPSASSTPTPPDLPHTGSHVVAPGESLWTIAAGALAATKSATTITDQQIATAVAAWYTTNRPVIGANPSLIRPGQQLIAPANTPTTTADPA